LQENPYFLGSRAQPGATDTRSARYNDALIDRIVINAAARKCGFLPQKSRLSDWCD
jgi:hypothetical protein